MEALVAEFFYYIACQALLAHETQVGLYNTAHFVAQAAHHSGIGGYIAVKATVVALRYGVFYSKPYAGIQARDGQIQHHTQRTGVYSPSAGRITRQKLHHLRMIHGIAKVLVFVVNKGTQRLEVQRRTYPVKNIHQTLASVYINVPAGVAAIHFQLFTHNFS